MPTTPLWLKHAGQLSLIWAASAYSALRCQLQLQFDQGLAATKFFSLTNVEAALLYLLLDVEAVKLVYSVRLPLTIAARHKGRQLDLATEFKRLPLFIGNRNNTNVLLQSVDNASLQQQLARFYGRNLLFSQFKNHQLLALLPTNQWVQPLLQQDFKTLNWRQILRKAYGSAFWQQYRQVCDGSIIS